MSDIATPLRKLAVRPRHPAIGIEVRGIDLAAPLTAGRLAALTDLWMQHPVLVFPEQPITDAEHVAFAQRFGELEIHPSVAHRCSRHPQIYRVSNVDEQGRILDHAGAAWQYMELTWLWHTDSSFRTVPSKGSILHGIEIPQHGGDTLFANMYAVWAALPAARQRELEGLRAVHSHDAILARSRGINARADRGDYEPMPPVEHPLVRRHPVSGRHSLFLSPHSMAGISGWPADEAAGLLDELAAFATREEFVYRHRWQPHDVLMWDNRCTMHAVMPYDSNRVRRIMHRCTIVGDAPPRG